MSSKFLPKVEPAILQAAISSEIDDTLYELLITPLLEELYKRQDFNFLDDLNEAQQLLLSYDYVRNQVLQGGFIQLIQNKYVGLLPDMPRWCTVLGIHDMAKLIDDVLKVYVLNHETLDKETTPEEFAKLYNEFKEFESLDAQFVALDKPTMATIMQYARHHIDEFVQVL